MASFFLGHKPCVICLSYVKLLCSMYVVGAKFFLKSHFNFQPCVICLQTKTPQVSLYLMADTHQPTKTFSTQTHQPPRMLATHTHQVFSGCGCPVGARCVFVDVDFLSGQCVWVVRKSVGRGVASVLGGQCLQVDKVCGWLVLWFLLSPRKNFFLLSPRIPPRKKIFARATRAQKFFSLIPRSSGSRTGGYLLNTPPLCKRGGVNFHTPTPFFPIFF